MRKFKSKSAHYLDVVVSPLWKAMPAITMGLILILVFQSLKTGKSNKEKLDKIPTPDYSLDFTTSQNVLREPPLFHLDESVGVEAKFENRLDTPIKVTAVVHWKLIDPPVNRANIDIAQFGLFLDFKPGCTEQSFINRPPVEVEIITRQLFNEGHEKVTWQLSGDNVIIAPENGGSQQFSVDSFSYIPDTAPLPASETLKDDRLRC